MRVLFDTNVLLDALLARESFVSDATFLLEAVELGQIKGFMSATTVTDVHYLVGRQTKSADAAVSAVTRLLALMEVCPVNREVLEQAVALKLSDFEDAVQVACAIASGLDLITTRDAIGFKGSPISVIEPIELKHILMEQDISSNE
ncbi:MAG: PIN domain-containing protein [Phormidesmis sp.]